MIARAPWTRFLFAAGLAACGEAASNPAAPVRDAAAAPNDAAVLGPVDAFIAVPVDAVVVPPPPDVGELADVSPFPDAEVSPRDAEPPPPPPPDLGPPPPVDLPRCRAFDAVPDDELLTALHTELHSAYVPIDALPDIGGTLNRYTTARNLMFVEAEYVRVDGEGGHECVYTGQFFATPPGVEPDDDLLNCEHVWPRSRMAPEETLLYSHEQSDLHHLYPALPGANSTRGSLPFGEVVTPRNEDWAPSLEGTDAEGHVVFEPRDLRKGDLARAILYFAVRWGAELSEDEEAALRTWHAADPPDAREAARNDSVEAVQGNRNPFTDCPALVERVPDFVPFEPLDSEANLARP